MAKKIKVDIEMNSKSVSDAEKDMKKFGDTTKNATVNLKKELRELTAELTRLKLAGQENSKQYQELTKRAAQLKDSISDVNREVNNLASDSSKIDQVMGAFSLLGSAVQATQATMQLFGSENEDVQKGMQKMVAIMSIMQAAQTIQNSLQKESAAMMLLQNIRTKTLIVTQTAYNWIVNATNLSMKALRATMMTLGAGAIIVGLGLLISKFSKVNDETKKIKANLDGMKDVDINIRASDQSKSLLDSLFDIKGVSAKERIKINFDTIEREFEKQRIEYQKFIKSKIEKLDVGPKGYIIVDLAFKKEQSFANRFKDLEDSFRSELDNIINDSTMDIVTSNKKINELSLQFQQNRANITEEWRLFLSDTLKLSQAEADQIVEGSTKMRVEFDKYTQAYIDKVALLKEQVQLEKEQYKQLSESEKQHIKELNDLLSSEVSLLNNFYEVRREQIEEDYNLNAKVNKDKIKLLRDELEEKYKTLDKDKKYSEDVVKIDEEEKKLREQNFVKLFHNIKKLTENFRKNSLESDYDYNLYKLSEYNDARIEKITDYVNKVNEINKKLGKDQIDLNKILILNQENYEKEKIFLITKTQNIQEKNYEDYLNKMIDDNKNIELEILQKTFDKEVEVSKDIRELGRQESIDKADFINKRKELRNINFREEYLQEERLLEQKYINNEIHYDQYLLLLEKLKTKRDSFSEMEKALQQEDLDAYHAYMTELLQIDQEYEQKRLESRQRMFQGFLDISNSLLEIQTKSYDTMMNAELEKAGDNERKKELIRQKYAKKEQKLAVARTWISGSEAIVKTFSQYGATPLGFIMATVQAALTSANVVNIKSQKLAGGGLVKPVASQDSVPAWLSPGEFVMNQTSTNMYKDELKQMNAKSFKSSMSENDLNKLGKVIASSIQSIPVVLNTNKLDAAKNTNSVIVSNSKF